MSEGRSYPEDYRTTTYRRREFPAPGDWALHTPEADGVSWSLHEGIDADHITEIDLGARADDHLTLLKEWDSDGTPFHAIIYDGSVVARIQDGIDEDRFWQIVAECLWWAVDEDAGDDPLDYADAENVRYETAAEREARAAEAEQRRLEETVRAHQTLDAFGGDSA